MNWFAVRNIPSDKVLMNLMKFSCSQIKVTLQYPLYGNLFKTVHITCKYTHAENQ